MPGSKEANGQRWREDEASETEPNYERPVETHPPASDPESRVWGKLLSAARNPSQGCHTPEATVMGTV